MKKTAKCYWKNCNVRQTNKLKCTILIYIGNENKQCVCYHFTYTALAVRMEVVLYGRASYVIINILTFLRFSRNDYYSICLNYYFSSDFEQIIKAPHYAFTELCGVYHLIQQHTFLCLSFPITIILIKTEKVNNLSVLYKNLMFRGKINATYFKLFKKNN